MPKSDTLTVPVREADGSAGERLVTVREMCVADILDLAEQAERAEGAGGDLDALRAILDGGRIVEGLSLDDLKGLAPSDIKVLWAKIREVNADFFGLLGLMGLTDKLVEIFRAGALERLAATGFGAAAAGSSGPDTPGSSGTAGGTSSMQ